MSINENIDNAKIILNEIDNKNNNNQEEELIIQYVNEIKNENTRYQAIENLYQYRDINKNIPIYLWYTRGTMAAILQEIINIYPYLSSSKLTNEKFNMAKNMISLFQTLALHPKTRKELIDSQLLSFLFPFLESTNNRKSYEKIIATVLGVIAALVKIDDPEIINFLIKAGVIPIILKIGKKGTELIKTITCFILQRIIVDINGLNYICEINQRLLAIIYVLESILPIKNNQKLLKKVLKIYLGLIKNKRAKEVLKRILPEKLKDKNFLRNLDDSSKIKAEILIKSFEEDEAGTDNKIMKLKNDLTTKNNNDSTLNKQNILNINAPTYNNFIQNNNNINNINIINNNINYMMFNNMNQMKMNTGVLITPPSTDFNYNYFNNNESYMNANLYNSNYNNMFGNMSMNNYESFNNL